MPRTFQHESYLERLADLGVFGELLSKSTNTLSFIKIIEVLKISEFFIIQL